MPEVIDIAELNEIATILESVGEIDLYNIGMEVQIRISDSNGDVLGSVKHDKDGVLGFKQHD